MYLANQLQNKKRNNPICKMIKALEKKNIMKIKIKICKLEK